MTASSSSPHSEWCSHELKFIEYGGKLQTLCDLKDTPTWTPCRSYGLCTLSEDFFERLRERESGQLSFDFGLGLEQRGGAPAEGAGGGD